MKPDMRFNGSSLALMLVSTKLAHGAFEKDLVEWDVCFNYLMAGTYREEHSHLKFASSAIDIPVSFLITFV